MLAAIRAVYAARVRGDIEDILSAFADDAVFRLNAAPLHGGATIHAVDSNELRAVLKRMFDDFEISNLEIIEAVIDGDKAAVRAIVTRRVRSSGRTTTTEVLDVIQFRNGKICSLTHFLDTAAVHALMPDVPGTMEH
jgi:ketosteroid isomerase-like protein